MGCSHGRLLQGVQRGLQGIAFAGQPLQFGPQIRRVELVGDHADDRLDAPVRAIKAALQIGALLRCAGIARRLLSARYSNWRGPVPGSHKGLTTPAVYGWLVCVDVNDKNSFGDYTGAHTYNLIIKNDQVVETTLGGRETCLING